MREICTCSLGGGRRLARKRASSDPTPTMVGNRRAPETGGLTGKEPELNTTWHLPNGEWTQTPAEQLRHTREVIVGNEGKISGSAQFIVEIKPEKVDSVHRVSGDDALEPLAGKLTEEHPR